MTHLGVLITLRGMSKSDVSQITIGLYVRLAILKAMGKTLSVVCSTIRYYLSKHKYLLKIWLWMKKFKITVAMRSLWIWIRRRWKILSASAVIALAIWFLAQWLWYQSLIPESWHVFITYTDPIMWVIFTILDFLRGRKPEPLTQEQLRRELTRSAEQTQRLRKEENTNKMHRDAVYKEICSLLSKYSGFFTLQHWLSYPDPDSFPEELSHLEAYNALGIARTVKRLCDQFNADLQKAINDIKGEFETNLALKQRVENKKISLQRYDIVPRPRNFYSPDILACNIFDNAENFQPYVVETIDGRFKIGNTVAETDNRAELQWFTELTNGYSLGKVELFKKLHGRERDAIAKRKDFFDALAWIKRKLDSGHSLEGKCDLCPIAEH